MAKILLGRIEGKRNQGKPCRLILASVMHHWRGQEYWWTVVTRSEAATNNSVYLIINIHVVDSYISDTEENPKPKQLKVTSIVSISAFKFSNARKIFIKIIIKNEKKTTTIEDLFIKTNLSQRNHNIMTTISQNHMHMVHASCSLTRDRQCYA